MRIDQASAEYLDHLKAQGTSPRTVASARYRLRLFSEYLQRYPVIEVQTLHSEHIRAYKHYLQMEYRYVKKTPNTGAPAPSAGQPLSVHSQANYFYRVRAFCQFLVKRRRMLYDPTVSVPGFAKPTFPHRIPSRSDIERFLAAVDGVRPTDLRDRAVLELFYSSGLRLSELQGLDVYDVDLRSAVVRVRHGKGGKERLAPLGEIAGRWLRKYLAAARRELVVGCGRRKTAGGRAMALFVSQMGRRLSLARIHQIIQAYGEATQVPMTAHRLRHACATHMLAGGADIRYIQELLGHAQLSTTQIYTTVTIGDLKAVHRRYHPREQEADSIASEAAKT